MAKVKQTLSNFTLFEKILWFCSVLIITVFFLAFDRANYLTLVASLIGVTALIFNAKGNPFGQFLMVIFAAIYGFISFEFKYYGEMITYVGMSGPMALFSLISWLRHPYKENKSEVEVNKVNLPEVIFMIFLTGIVTVIFYFILKYFGTANLLPSTLSVTTSFAAVYLSFRRSPYFAFAYATNDIVLIILWALAGVVDKSYFSVLMCFVVFLVNDTYSFVNWLRIRKRQKRELILA